MTPMRLLKYRTYFKVPLGPTNKTCTFRPPGPAVIRFGNDDCMIGLMVAANQAR